MANLLSLLLPLLISISISGSASVFVSIDCGSKDMIYTDSNNIVWEGDDTLIQNGESRLVKNSSSVSQVMSTLRVFSTRKKNCYSVDVDKGIPVLVRASFYYGNYDGRSSPPTFDLQFDGNDWATVTTLMDLMVYYEVIYVPKGVSISVCVAQTKPNQLPFISALEVRSLGEGMYDKGDPNLPLFLSRRFAFGANESVRFSDDPYDRIWVATAAANGLTAVTSDLTFTSSNTKDSPPSSVLLTAITPTVSTDSIILHMSMLTGEVPVYINTYFSEMSQLDSTATRSFSIFADNRKISDPIVPPYQDAVEYTFNGTANSNTTISLVATSDSTLPPLINAMEIFQVGDALTDGTNSNDVQALSLLQQQFVKLQDWSGDPCLPATFNWDWVACSSDAIPRITALYLSGFQLDGILPDFSSMDALQTIDLHNNTLNGGIPDFLGSLPNLKELNLADNDFSGSMPSTISENKKIKLEVSGNPNLCVSGDSCTTSDTGTSSGTGSSTRISYHKKSKVPVILGTSIPAFLGFWISVGTVAFILQKRKAASISAVSAGQMGGQGKPNGPPQAANGHGPIGGHGQSMNNDFNVEIEQQMGAELADLMEQQAQENENGRND
ncbi:hypothetical protein MRB53_029385 [Persea americana]|uniref:Uncharacterized protein n=1 Tax=Persea americana TaxID=3435 RepID=A0ACC2KIL1_PERAE|nr:hypothetical protein MRB53_029385 [Persea americana]